MVSLKYRWVAVVGSAVLCSVGCSIDSDVGLTGETVGGSSSSTSGATDEAGETGFDTDPDTGTSGESNTAGGTGDECDTAGGEEDSCCDDFWPGELSRSRVTLSITVNGSVHQGSSYDDGDIFLVDQSTGDRAYFGRVNQGTLSAWVLDGKYDVVYEGRPEASTLPENQSVVVLSSVIVYGDDLPVAVNIESTEVELTLMVNGEAPTASAYDDGLISVSDTGYEHRTLVGKTSTMVDGKLKMRLVPGSYEIFYESEDQQKQMPHNRLARIGAISVAEPAQMQEEEVNLEVVELSGDILFDGEAPPASTYDHGRIYLRDQWTQAVTEIADTADGSIPATPVIAGSATYDVFYAAEAVQLWAPANTWGRLNTMAIMGVNEPLSAMQLKEKLASLQIPTFTVTGEITVDSELKPADPDNRGDLLVADGSGERAQIGDVSGGIQARLLRSDYDLFFRHEVSNGGLPANTFGMVEGNSLPAMQKDPIEVNVKTSTVSGMITVNGETPSLSDYDKGELFLRNAAGDRVFLAQTNSGSYSRRIMDGTYDVYYAVKNSQGGVPANHETMIEADVVIQGGEMEHSIDISAYPLVRILPELGDGATGEARFFVRKFGTEDEIFVGKSGEMTEILLLEGGYELVYRVENRGTRTAINDGAVIGCTTPG